MSFADRSGTRIIMLRLSFRATETTKPLAWSHFDAQSLHNCTQRIFLHSNKVYLLLPKDNTVLLLIFRQVIHTLFYLETVYNSKTHVKQLSITRRDSMWDEVMIKGVTKGFDAPGGCLVIILLIAFAYSLGSYLKSGLKSFFFTLHITIRILHSLN